MHVDVGRKKMSGKYSMSTDMLRDNVKNILSYFVNLPSIHGILRVYIRSTAY